jgi:DNA-directed RNA polymerase subunit RPC12/RpoP
MNINDFGRKNHINWTAEDLRKEREAEMDKEYICLSCGETFQEWELDVCEMCGHIRCPRLVGKGRKRMVCGGEVSTIEEYEEAMKAND